MTAGDTLKRKMDEAGIGISELSEVSGVARSTISRMIASGEGMLYSWKAVANALGIRVSELMED